MPKRIQQAIAKAPASDPQRERLYRMERESMGGWSLGRVSLKEAQAFMRRVARLYGVGSCKVRDANLGVWAGEYRAGVITRSTSKGSGRGMVTLVHEAAHHLHEQLAPGNEHEGHGPEFMCAYIHLLDRSRLLIAGAGKALCERYRLRFIDPGDCRSFSKLGRQINGAAAK